MENKLNLKKKTADRTKIKAYACAPVCSCVLSSINMKWLFNGHNVWLFDQFPVLQTAIAIQEKDL